jgi:PKD repeat protein
VRHTTTTQVEKKGGSSGGGGGSKKALWIGLGVLAAGAGAYFLLKDSNEAPTVSGASANPATGLAAATSVQFSVQAADPDGDALTVTWNFGDGGSGSGNNPSHVYQNAGTFNVTVTVSDGEKSATGSTSVTIRSLSGAWGGTLAGTLTSNCNFTQNAAAITGTCNFPQVGDTGTISGTVSAALNVRFNCTIPGFQPFTFNGSADAEVNRLTGTVTGSGFNGNPWTLNRR